MKCLALFCLFGVYACSAQVTGSPGFYVDRRCGEDLGNLWLEVVAVVDNSIGMTNQGLTDIAANIASVFSDGTRIGTEPSEPRTTRVGLVTYNSQANIAADLNDFHSIDDLYNGVFTDLQSVSNSDESYLVHGLALAEEVLEVGKQTANRSHFQRVVIVYASTYKGSGSLDPLPVAERLKTAGVTIITVAYDQAGDGALLTDLAKIASPRYSFSNTDTGSTIGEIQGALLQVNCFCPNSWEQYRVSFNDRSSYRYGVCIQAIGLTAVWRAAKISCKNRWRSTYLATEFDADKHDFILSTVKNTTGFHQPFTYHIGLNQVNGVWKWDQPDSAVQQALQTYTPWNPSYPIASSSLTSVLNQQPSTDVSTGWQNTNPMTTAANYVCETISCDTDNYCSSVTSN